MCLPYEAMDYPKLLDGEVKSKRIGLLLDIGTGLPLQPAVRDAIERAAKLFAAAGATVEPVKPFVTPAMVDGLDVVFRSRAWAAFEQKIGRASCRDRVCQYVLPSVVAASLTKKKQKKVYTRQNNNIP